MEIKSIGCDNMEAYKGITRDRLDEILKNISGVNAGLLGDVCLDVYWRADMRKSELSLETPHFPLPVVDERMSLGGGANVVANMIALHPKKVQVFSVIGNDWRGRELLRLLDEAKAGLSGVIQKNERITNAYIKPIRQGISDVAYEDPRLDFTDPMPLTTEDEDKLIAELDKAAGSLDVLCISDQMYNGIVTQRVREHVCELARKGLKIVADSRYNIRLFSGVTLKPNELEGTKAVGLDINELHKVSGCIEVSDFINVAKTLTKKSSSNVFMTIGARGSIYVNEEQAWYIPAQKITGPIDIVGAGDSSLSGFGLALAAGAKPQEAAYIAGICSGITIKQIGVTGTAARKQILETAKCL